MENTTENKITNGFTDEKFLFDFSDDDFSQSSSACSDISNIHKVTAYG